jgi:Reverse transcriptase (RNA-dependent DNA polymerase)
LAKKTHICEPSDTRPIPLLDIFQKIGEKLFLSRYKKVLDRLGLLPINQSDFREKHRLQTRVLLFIDEIFNHLANSSPVATMFVDFKRAFDMLWHEGCVEKCLRMGIPGTYTEWILRWLEGTRGFVEIGNCRSD